MCMYSIQAHDGAVAAITCSASYIISIGTDERLCVWERFQGHLLHALPAQKAAYSFQLVMLTQQLLITSNQVRFFYVKIHFIKVILAYESKLYGQANVISNKNLSSSSISVKFRIFYRLVLEKYARELSSFTQ